MMRKTNWVSSFFYFLDIYSYRKRNKKIRKMNHVGASAEKEDNVNHEYKFEIYAEAFFEMDNVKRAYHWGHRTCWYLSDNCNKVFWTLHFVMYMSSSLMSCPSVNVFIWRSQIFEKRLKRKLIYISIRSIREILSFFARCSYGVWNYICIQNGVLPPAHTHSTSHAQVWLI